MFMLCKEELSSGPYYRSQSVSHFTSIQEAALLKIPMTVKSCYTGSCQHPLTTASSAESCPKTCFLQATFIVCCHKVIILLSQQTNVENFAFLDMGITVRRTRVKHPAGNFFFFPSLEAIWPEEREDIQPRLPICCDLQTMA